MAETTYEDLFIPGHLKRFNAYWDTFVDGWNEIDKDTDNTSNGNEVKAYVCFNALVLTGQLMRAIKIHKKIQDCESDLLEEIMSHGSEMKVNEETLKHEEAIRQIAEGMKIGYEIRKSMLDVLCNQIQKPGYEKAKKLFLEEKGFEFHGNWETFYKLYMENEVEYILDRDWETNPFSSKNNFFAF